MNPPRTVAAWTPQRCNRLRAEHWLPTLALLAALFFGLVVSVVSPMLGLGLGVALVGAAALVMRPDWAWVVTLLLVAQAIPGTLVPDIPVGFARLKAYELTFLAGLVGSLWPLPARTATEQLARVQQARWLSMLLMAAILGSAFYSHFYLGNRELVLAEARPYLALLSLGYVAVQASAPGRERLFDRALISAGSMLSAVVVLQFVTGMRFLDARVEDLGLSANTGITRSLTDTGTIVQAYAIYRLSQVAASRERRSTSRFVAALFLVICVVGLLGTFTRSAWLAIASGALVAAYVGGGVARAVKVAMLGAAFLVATVAGIFMVRPTMAEAVIDRALSVSSELESGASYGWRKLENRLAWESIQRHPLLGVALGGAYKNEVRMNAGFLNDQYFIHNGYLYFPLKMGVPGVLFGLWLLWQLVRLILQHKRDNPWHAAQAGACVVILVINIPAPALSKFLPLFLLMSFISLRAAESTADTSQP